MTCVGDQVEILTRESRDRFLGISYFQNSFILTYTDCITVYDTVHKKISNSWTIGKGQRFTCTCVYNKEDDEFVVAVNSNVIKTFKDNFDKGAKFTVNSDVHSIVCVDTPAVVFSCGVIISLSEVLANPKQTPDQGPLSAFHIEQFLFQNPVSFLVKNNKESSIKVLSENDCSVIKHIPLQHQSAELISSCLYKSNADTTLVSLWSNGSVCTTVLTTSSLNENNITIKEAFTIPSPQISHKNLLSSLSCDKVAVVTSKDEILIMDLKFGVVHDKVKANDVIEIKCLENYLLIVGSQSVSMCHLTESSVDLSSVFGKRSQSISTLPTTSAWQTRSNSDEAMRVDNEDGELFNILLKSKTLTEMKKTWLRLCQNKSLNQLQIITSSSLMSQFLEKLCDPKQKWMPTLIKMILNCGSLSSRSHPALIDRIISSGDIELLSIFFTHVQNINEYEIVKVLNHLLPRVTSSMGPQLANVISLIVKIPYTENVLVEEFRNLEFEKVLVLVSHLTTKLKTETVSTQSNINGFLSWVCLLVDAHYAQIIVNSDAWDTLIDLQEVVAVQMELYKDMKELDVIISKIEASRQVKIKSNQLSSYHIEVMTI